MVLVATISSVISPPFFSSFSVLTFSHRRNARIKKLTGAPKILGDNHFPDPVGHCEAPWQPFWIFEVLIEGMMESKNLMFDDNKLIIFFHALSLK